MQVVHGKGHVTHAVIGGEKTIDFGISNDAAFFQILSSTLYTNQILAVVREVLCNAWDAHIEAGKTDVPIQVSIKNNELVIKDFGKGIPKEMMGQIYGTYGQSTKKANGQVTGGFGLGCKAPFAYTDHFEVTSCSEGLKTIYRISKSSAQTEGKPGITPIVTIPTDETGLTVKINLNSWDIANFREYIFMVISNGEMLAMLSFDDNTVLAPTVPFSKAKHGFTIIFDKRITGQPAKLRIYIRYGHVIYPLDSHEQYNKEYHILLKILDNISPNSMYSMHKKVFVIQADPHSITVTPSRESLSMQGSTIKAIKQLLEKVVDHFDVNMRNANINSVKKQIKIADESCMTSFHRKLPSIIEHTTTTILQSVNEVSDFIVSNNVIDAREVNKLIFAAKARFIYKQPNVHKGLAKTFLKEVLVRKGSSYPSDWVFKVVYCRLLKQLYKIDPTTSTRNLLVYNSPSWGSVIPRTSFSYASTIESLPLRDAAKFLDNVVILTTSKLLDSDRYTRLAGNLRASPAIVCYTTRKNKALPAIRKYLSTRRDITFIDLTVRYEWEETDKVTYKKYVGIPALSNVPLSLAGIPCVDDFKSMDKDSYKRITNPKFIVKFEKHDRSISVYNTYVSGAIIKLYGDVGGVYTVDSQKEKYISAGAVDVTDFLIDQIIHELTHNKRIIRHLSNSASFLPGRTSTDERVGSVIRTITSFSEIAKPLNLFTKLTERDNHVLRILHELRANVNPQAHPKKDQLLEILRGITISKSLLSLVNKVKNDLLLQALNSDAVSHYLRSRHTVEDGERADKFVALLLNYLK